jgi:hypothetical protein
MKPKTVRIILDASLLIAAICGCFLIYNFFCPNLPKVYHTCIVIEGILSIIIIVIVLTKKKWDKQDSDKSNS